jgi:glycosyltransferase involved in cell wall biosynthesis
MGSIAILTTFRDADPAYSLNRVVIDQIKMLTIGGYGVRVVVAEGFKPVDVYAQENVTLFTIPDVRVSNEMNAVKDDTFTEDIQKLTEAYRKALEGVDVAITHDLVYQPAQVKHQIATRQIANESPNIKWLHWIHSATSPQTLIMERNFYQDDYLKFLVDPYPNSYYVFFNNWSRRRVAANFGVPVDRVKTVYHPTDVMGWLNFHPISKEIIERNDLLSADMICVYPARLDNGKQVPVALELMIRVRAKGFDTRMVVVDFHSTSSNPSDSKYQQRQLMKAMAKEWKYEDKLIFVSEHSPETKSSVPHQVIRDLMLISNIFVMPSRSESYSLVTQEAALTKNLLILNEDFPPFKEIFGEDNLFIRVSSNVNKDTGLDGETNTQYSPSRDQYFEEKSLEIVETFQRNHALRTNAFIRKTRNLKYVWEHQLKPLIEDA